MLSLALGAIKGCIGIFDASDQFKLGLAILTGIFINWHKSSKL